MLFNPDDYIEYVEELFNGRDGTPFRSDYNREYVQLFLVVTNDKRASNIIVCSATGIPLPFDHYSTDLGGEEDTNALCVELSARQMPDDQYHWIVTAKFSTVVPAAGPPADAGNPGGGKNGCQDNPELEPADTDWDFEIVQKALPYDLNGKPFVSSAGQPFVPAPTFEVSYPILNITFNELQFNYQEANEFAFSVNRKDFLNSPPETVQCFPPKVKEVYRGNLRYYRVTYKLKFKIPTFGLTTLSQLFGLKNDTWQPKILDQGTLALEQSYDPDTGDPAGLKQVNIIGNDNVIAHHPVLLDGKGQKAPYTPPVNGIVQNTNPFYLDFEVYRKADFSKFEKALN